MIRMVHKDVESRVAGLSADSQAIRMFATSNMERALREGLLSRKDASAAADALMKAMKGENYPGESPPVQMQATSVVGMLARSGLLSGDQLEKARASLREALNDPSIHVREAAEFQIGFINANKPAPIKHRGWLGRAIRKY